MGEFRESLKWLIAKEEMYELQIWESTWHKYDRWLSEFPDVELVLKNLRQEVKEKSNLNPDFIPDLATRLFTIAELRDALHRLNDLKNHS